MITEQLGNVTFDGFHQVKIATLENRTNSIEQNMILLTSKLENLQFNFLAGNRVSATETIRRTKQNTKGPKTLYV